MSKRNKKSKHNTNLDTSVTSGPRTWKKVAGAVTPADISPTEESTPIAAAGPVTSVVVTGDEEPNNGLNVLPKKRGGDKYGDKYNVKLASNFNADPDEIIIAELGHFLHDPDGNVTFNETRVKFIDEAGQCITTIPVWSDPDKRVLYAIDGRGNVLDCREVNRRRRDRHDKPITICTMRFDGTQQQAEDLVAQKNFLRKVPTLLHTAREIVRFHRLGRSWERVAENVGLVGEDEKALRARAPIAYCEPEVIVAFEAKEISPKKAKRFGGGKIDGSARLGRAEQLDLLSVLRGPKAPTKDRAASAGSKKPTRAVERAAWSEVASRLANGGAKNLTGADLTLARGIAAAFRFRDGEIGALDAWPKVKLIIETALADLTAGSSIPGADGLPPLIDDDEEEESAEAIEATDGGNVSA